MNTAAAHSAASKTSELHLVAALVVAMAPHVLHLPPWVMVCTAAIICWQALALVRNRPPVGRTLRLLLCLLAFGSVYLAFGRINGRQAGASLLVLMLALKLTELNSHRDKSLTLYLAYFLLITQFLFSQSIGMSVYMLFAAWLITASLVDVSHPQGPLPVRRSLKSSAALLGQALPLMALLFVLFPRIPGPLWGLPKPNETATTGLGNHMSPSSIARLARNNSIVFRVTFEDKPPPRNRRYWRGPVLEDYDGATWTHAEQHATATPIVSSNTHLTHYEVILEATDNRRLPALALPVAGPPRASFTRTGLMLADKPVRHRILYHASSALDYRYQIHLNPATRRRDLTLPGMIDPKSRKLVRQWQAHGLQGVTLARRAMRYFQNQSFYYTLQPPTLSGPDKVDQFLFGTRQGFCGHYAGAFTVLMRLAGIPARVVTGYYGGEHNKNGDYFIVRNSNAHAWSEIWIAGQGWLRFDPTSMIPASRVKVSQSPAGAGERAPVDAVHGGFWRSMSLHWDWVKMTWERSILAYGPDLQSAFLTRFGLPDWRSMLLALTGFCVGFLALLGVILMWQVRPQWHKGDPIARAWQRFCRRLARQGLPRAPHEGPLEYGQRIASRNPLLAEETNAIVSLYIGLRYRNLDDPLLARQFRHRVRKFRGKKR